MSFLLSELVSELELSALDLVSQTSSSFSLLPTSVICSNDIMCTNDKKKLKYEVGDIVQTRIVYGRKDGPVRWILSEITTYNPADDTWDLRVLHPNRHHVLPRADHVPDMHIRKYNPEVTVLQHIILGIVSLKTLF